MLIVLNEDDSPANDTSMLYLVVMNDVDFLILRAQFLESRIHTFAYFLHINNSVCRQTLLKSIECIQKLVNIFSYIVFKQNEK